VTSAGAAPDLTAADQRDRAADQLQRAAHAIRHGTSDCDPTHVLPLAGELTMAVSAARSGYPYVLVRTDRLVEFARLVLGEEADGG
jgi:hypothetical protein